MDHASTYNTTKVYIYGFLSMYMFTSFSHICIETYVNSELINEHRSRLTKFQVLFRSIYSTWTTKIDRSIYI